MTGEKTVANDLLLSEITVSQFKEIIIVLFFGCFSFLFVCHYFVEIVCKLLPCNFVRRVCSQIKEKLKR